MMQDEYQSALLWHEDYVNSIKKESRKKQKKEKTVEKPKKKEKSIFARIFKRSEKKKEEKAVEKEPTEEKPDIVKDQYKAIDQKNDEAERKKIRTLLKIKRQQEKQRK